MSTSEIPVDVEVLRDEIQKTYTEVSTQPGEDFIFPTGRGWAEDLAYPQPELSNVPDASVDSFAGVANPHSLGRLEEGATVLDLGCGAGTDLLIAAQMVGPFGHVIGVDMTPAMLRVAAASAREMGITDRVEVHESLIESVPLPNGEVDIVISNGVLDLVPDKGAVCAEIEHRRARLDPSQRMRVRDAREAVDARVGHVRQLRLRIVEILCPAAPGREDEVLARQRGDLRIRLLDLVAQDVDVDGNLARAHTCALSS